MKRKLDIANWPRKDLFYFFKEFDEPFFGVCVEVDCTQAYKMSKEKGTSFFLYYLHKSLQAVNETDPFKYRILDDEVIIHDMVRASATIGRDNNQSFGFSFIDYAADYDDFVEIATAETARVQNSTGLELVNGEDNIIHYSSVPWINFTSLSHARSFKFKDSVPKISFGKVTERNGKMFMPVSIHVHHALLDGYHVGQYIDRFQELLNGL